MTTFSAAEYGNYAAFLAISTILKATGIEGKLLSLSFDGTDIYLIFDAESFLYSEMMEHFRLITYSKDIISLNINIYNIKDKRIKTQLKNSFELLQNSINPILN